jgi:polysaccharide pyruvyl transferase WcaK-like protein
MKTKIWFFGHFGSGNFGNEITFQTSLYHVRQRLPEAEFACICTNPETLAATYGIAAVPISRNFGGARKRRTGLARLLRKIFIGIPCEMFRWIEAFRTLKGADMLVIPGTGLLTDAYGIHEWGPYSLFKWSFVSKLRGCRLLFMSVGAGPLYSGLGIYFVKSALSLGEFRSYRDKASLDCLKKVGFHGNGDRVFPDLVFSAPETMLPRSGDTGSNRAVVGIGLMDYAGKYSVANPTDDVYTSYLECLSVFVKWLLSREYGVRLFLGEAGDTASVSNFKSLLKKSLGTYDEGRIIYQPAHCVEELLPQIAAVDIVVATRFHNVLLSLLLNKPVIAISFHHKCASLMSQMGVSEYIHDINDMNADRLIGQFMDIEKKEKQLKSIIRKKVEQSRKALDEQYNLIFKGGFSKISGQQPLSGVSNFVK